ncbi:FAD/NAD(P)-binding domain-containing protein [Astrocystis sublimbata]|nr:FAD/NAD(P)-binding domain-containing protein [Astrocystis sublimbata]
MSSTFKVIIVGGGIAGLSLANMLEKFDIEYVLLEARDEIAPREGAAIGLMPNGSFILEQLGLFEAIKAAAPDAEIQDSHIRDSTGKPIISLKHMMYHQNIRHGYPMLFFDRRVFLEVLFEQLKHKDKVICNSKVCHLEQFDKGVRVKTKDGQSHMGDIVVGADGIHSTIRKTLYKTAELSEHDEEDNVPCYYQCSFGIAQDVEGWPQSEQCFTSGRGKSFLVVSGPEGRCYWFLFVRYPRPKYGSDIPRYSPEDEANFVNEHRNLMVREGLAFGQLYAKRVTSGLTPLHEVVFNKWFLDRVLLIGDAVHKPNPIGGMGGNAAIETAAELVNALVDVREKRDKKLDSLTVDEIRDIFKHVQDSRFQRANFTVAASHELQSLLAMEKPILATIALRVLLPLAGKHNFFRDLSSRIVGGSRLKHLDLPSRQRAIPYDHELPSKPITGYCSFIIRSLFCATVIFLIYRNRSSLEVEGCELESPNDTPVAFINYLVSILSPLLIYNIEGFRIGRQGSFMSLPLILMIEMATRGVGRSTLSYALLSMLHSPLITIDRPVPTSCARSLIPATVLGFLLPAVGLSLTSVNADACRWRAAAPLTILVAFYAVLSVVRVALKCFEQRSSSDDPEKHTNWYSADDMPSLNTLYKLVFFIQASTAVATVVSSYQSSRVTLALPIMFDQPPSSLGTELIRINAGAMVNQLHLVSELQRQGYISTKRCLQVVGTVLLGSPIIGPAACWIAVYWWRENVLLALSVQGST